MKIYKLLLLVLIPISFVSQSENDIINHINNIIMYNNHFMKQYMDFNFKLYHNNTNVDYSLYDNLINQHKVTLKSLENIDSVSWDNDVLSNVKEAYKKIGKVLELNKNKVESLLINSKNIRGLQDEYNYVIETQKLNSSLALLQNEIKNEIRVLSNMIDVNIDEVNGNYEVVKSIEKYNVRSKFINSLIVIYLPVLIDLEKLYITYSNKDTINIKAVFSNLEKTIKSAEIKMSMLQVIPNGNYLLKSVNSLIEHTKNFTINRANNWVIFIYLSIPNQNSTEKEYYEYNRLLKEVNENINIYNSIFNTDYKIVKQAILSLMQF